VKTLLDYLVNSPTAAVSGVLGIAGVVVALIPGLHSWAWLFLLVLALLLLAGLFALAGEWRRTQAKIDDLHTELATARAQIGGLTAVSSPEDDEQTDQAPAREILGLLPTSGGIIEHLRIQSGPSGFTTAELAPVRTLVDDYTKTAFSTHALHAAFMELYRCSAALLAWIDKQTKSTEDGLELIPGDQRDGGWREFAQVRTRGADLAGDFLAARQAFETAALEAEVL
jgi:hypothetical protein